MTPFSSKSLYVNDLGNESQDRVRPAYRPATYTRLVDLKNRFDPTNLFRMDQNVQPTVAQQDQDVD